MKPNRQSRLFWCHVAIATLSAGLVPIVAEPDVFPPMVAVLCASASAMLAIIAGALRMADKRQWDVSQLRRVVSEAIAEEPDAGLPARDSRHPLKPSQIRRLRGQP